MRGYDVGDLPGQQPRVCLRLQQVHPGSALPNLPESELDHFVLGFVEGVMPGAPSANTVHLISAVRRCRSAGSSCPCSDCSDSTMVSDLTRIFPPAANGRNTASSTSSSDSNPTNWQYLRVAKARKWNPFRAFSFLLKPFVNATLPIVSASGTFLLTMPMLTHQQKLAHLYSRAGFGLSPAEWIRRRDWSIEQAVVDLFRKQIALLPGRQ